MIKTIFGTQVVLKLTNGPPYSYFIPFFLFPNLEIALKGQRFQNVDGTNATKSPKRFEAVPKYFSITAYIVGILSAKE